VISGFHPSLSAIIIFIRFAAEEYRYGVKAEPAVLAPSQSKSPGDFETEFKSTRVKNE
jgi:hypothetical protein